jgi:alanyl-tRNA synthetase
VTALAGTVDGKPSVIVATNEAARKIGANAGTLAKLAASVLGGGGGGKDDLAQGGGSNVSAIGAALDAIRESLVA